MTAYIEFKGVKKAFGAKPVLKGMDLAVNKGEVMFIIGTSGVGKSVTIKHLIGLLRIDAGEIWFDGARVDEIPERQLAPLRRRIGMVFQFSTLFDSMTLAENVALPLRKHQRMSQAAALDEAKQRLAQVYMDDYADRYPAELSDGMRKRAAIARTLALSPDVVLFDEPTTGLDPIMADVINNLIIKTTREVGATALSITHDMASARKIARRIAMLYQGRIIWAGPVAQIDRSGDDRVEQFIHGRAEGPIQMAVRA